jgi:hypothetical protein
MCGYASYVLSIMPVDDEGNTMPGVIAPASRALAVGDAEQAACPSKAAIGQDALDGQNPWCLSI